MAEIDIEKKNGGGGKIWLWVIIVLIVAGLLYWWFAGDGEEVEEVGIEEVEDETVMTDQKTTSWQEATALAAEIKDKPGKESAAI